VISSWSGSFAPSGYRFPREVIGVAVRWYLRYGLSYRDVEELLAERAAPRPLRAQRRCARPRSTRHRLHRARTLPLTADLAPRPAIDCNPINQRNSAVLSASRRKPSGRGEPIPASCGLASLADCARREH
jgi:hypothetical protein